MGKSFWRPAQVLAAAGAGAVLVGACGGSGPATPAEVQKPLNWQMQSNAPNNSGLALAETAFADQLSQKTGGKVKLNIHFNNSLGLPPAQMVSLTSKGTVDVGELLGSFVGGEFPMETVPEAPGLIPYDVALREKIAAGLIPNFDQVLSGRYNQTVLMACQVDGRALISNKPVTGLSSLAGLKTRATGAIEVGLTQKFGGIPVANVGASDIYPGLQTGSLNAAWAPASYFYQVKLYEVAKSVLNVNTAGAYTILSVNKDSYNQLTAANKNLIADLGKQAGTACFENTDKLAKSAISDLRSQGVTVTDLSSSDQALLKQAATPLLQDFVAKGGPDVQKAYDTIQQVLKANGR